jgi:hypothetical protein
MFNKLILAVALGGALSLPVAGAAEAAIGDGAGFAGGMSAPMSQIKKAQFIFGGRNFCWYADGWQGPGFYWCGYAHRQGLGFGGGEGWHGWNGGGGGHGGGGHGGGGHGGGGHGGGRGFAGGHGGGAHFGGGGGMHGGGHGGGGHGGHGGGHGGKWPK